MYPASSSPSCSSSAVVATGQASSRVRCMAAGSSAPRSSTFRGSVARRVYTACVRRSSRGASSRKVYTAEFSNSWQNTEGSGVSFAIHRTSPLKMRSSTGTSRGRSIASSRPSFSACLTSGWSGTSRAPWILSIQAAASGKTPCSRSSAYMRCSCAGTRTPLRLRGTASASVVLQRQRVSKIGESSTAWISVSRTVFG